MLNSIRTRLTLWYLGILAVLIVAFAVVIYFLVARNLSQTTEENLNEIANSITADLRKEEVDLTADRISLTQPDPGEELDEDDKKKAEELKAGKFTIETAIAETITDLRFRAFGFQVFDQNDHEIASTITDSSLREKLKDLNAASTFADVQGEKETFRVHQTLLTLDGKAFRLFTARSLREQTEFLSSLRKIFYVSVPVALVLAGLGGYFLARRSLAPVVSMSGQAASIGSSNLNERLAVKNNNDELGGLARVFNDLLARLERSFNQQKQFMADASHELRTPLAIIRGESEVAISKGTRPADEYLESLSVVHDESLRLTKIVEDLFTLARADSGQLRPQFTEIYLDELLAECVRHVRVLAERKQISVDFSTVGDVSKMAMSGDENLLRELFLNLLDNAIKYGSEGGKVSVMAEKSVNSYVVTVVDTGNGISKDEQAKIFDRFFRSDKARTRADKTSGSGAGLGLSIAKWVAEIHNGEIAIVKSDETGSAFKIILPEK